MVSIADTLAGSLQNNVFAIQRIQSELTQVQQRLTTGRRVNTVLDNPGNFFTASGFSSRAARLSTTLDNIIAQNTILSEASNGITSLTDLVNSLKTTAEEAQTTIAANEPEATITGSRNLSDIANLVSVSGISNNDRLVFRYVDSTGSITSSTVTINNGDSTDDLLNEINAITNTAVEQVFEATINSAGQLNIKTQDNTRFEINFQNNGGAADTQLVAALGFSNYTLNERTAGVNATRITVSPTASLTTIGLYDQGTNDKATLSSTLFDLTTTSAGPARDIFNGDANDALLISINGGTPSTVVSDISTATLQDIIDGVNNNGSLKSQIKASFDSGAGALNIRAIDDSVVSIQFQLTEDAANLGTAGKIDLQKLGIGAQVLQSAADGSGTISSESIQLGPGVSDLISLENEFDSLRSQITELINDSEVNDLNLLAGDNLTIVFNSENGSALTIEGQNFADSNIGISTANFGNTDTITNAINQIDSALDDLETFSTSLDNDQVVIEARETFLENTIAALNSGADDLTLVDEEADSALLQALQARQNLSITVLGLSSQEQISVLRVF